MELEENKEGIKIETFSRGKKKMLSFGTFTKKEKYRRGAQLKKVSFFDLQPILFGQVFMKEKEIVLITLDKKVVITSKLREDIETVSEILFLCDGVTTIDRILKNVKNKGYNVTEVIVFLQQLLRERILVDSRKSYLSFHSYLINPTYFYHNLSEEEILSFFDQDDELEYKGKQVSLLTPRLWGLCGTLSRRKSSRSFKKRSAISFQIFSEILWAAYGISGRIDIGNKTILRRTVPSGGALYPLHLHCIVWGEVEKVLPGVYYFKKNEHSIQRIKGLKGPKEVIERLIPVPGGEEMIKEAILLLVISSNFQRSSQKYSNRGYLYSILEAGHVAQNVYLFCTEQNLDVVEIGGFKEKELSEFLEIKNPEIIPLTSLLIG